MLKKNLPFILIALVTLLMIAIVIWMFDKRIKSIEKRPYNSTLLKRGNIRIATNNHTKTK
jgi:hypothetical protein